MPRRRGEISSGDVLLRHLLLAGNRDSLALAGTGVRMRPLTTHRQATAMPQAAVAAKVHQTLDVHRHFAPQIALDPEFTVDQLADTQDLIVAQLVDPAIVGDAELLANRGSLGRANAVNVA